MSLIIYGGDRPLVEKQLACQHRWHGPCMDDTSRFNQCLDCSAVERDLSSMEEYLRASKEAGDRPKESPKTVWLVESGDDREGWQSVDSIHSTEEKAVARAVSQAKTYGCEKPVGREGASFWRERKGGRWISANERDVDEE